jgi:hypothetical protein
MEKVVMGIQLKERTEDSTGFQSILSKYGSIIQTRIGLHETAIDSSGIIVLDFVDDAGSKVDKLEKELSEIGNISIQKMFF